jgi:hypothetical protein
MLGTGGLLAFAVLFVLGPDEIAQERPAPGRYTIYGFGARSCGAWVEARREESLTATAYEGWMLGFVSGYGYGSEDQLRVTDAKAMSVWLDNYCQAHPLDTIAVASQALVRELAR